MKKIMYFIICLIALSLTTCSDNDDNKEKVVINGDEALIDVLAGGLKNLIEEHDFSGIKTVRIRGKMNLYDFRALSNVPELEHLDIGHVILVGGKFEENLCTFISDGEENYFLWKWAFRCLGDEVILRYPKLNSIILPIHSKVTDSEIFAYYINLEKVVLSQDLSSLGTKAFYECPLKAVYSKSIEPPHVGSDAFSELLDNCILYVPKGTKRAYQETEGWKAFKNIEEE